MPRSARRLVGEELTSDEFDVLADALVEYEEGMRYRGRIAQPGRDASRSLKRAAIAGRLRDRLTIDDPNGRSGG